ncbi:MAG: heavy metal-binding domain-containing protein [Caldilineaceae bacterium]|nr:heavy metal-binding domain-containing protein [Caldilineaceae bacterium]
MLIALDQLSSAARLGAPDSADSDTVIEVGELLTAVTVMAANVVRDIRENIRNLVGGRMTHYEQLIDEAVQKALDDLEQKAKRRGYDGVIGVKIATPTVVDGGVEVVVYGNGFRLHQSSAKSKV